MDVLKFTLKGETAFFKKPDVNTYLYFTYGNIHKVALLGIFGAILGYKGYNQMSFLSDYKKQLGKSLKEIGFREEHYPEFYSRLKDLKVAIVRNSINISKKVQVFNNSVGYASKEQGGNLIVKEQWLENPSWDIYVSIDSNEAKDLAKALMDNSFVYIPYLGKNDHLADISKVELIENIREVQGTDRIHSLFLKQQFTIEKEDGFEAMFSDESTTKEPKYKYEERLPIALEEANNKYEFETFVATNERLKLNSDTKVYKANERNIVFF